jgi:uncharacterized protein YegP (UPF0339 family)
MNRGAKRKGAQREQMPRIEIYQETNTRLISVGDWRWRLVGANGKILADSGEGYTRKADVKRALGTVLEAIDLAHVYDLSLNHRKARR